MELKENYAFAVLHHYKLTRFSNDKISKKKAMEFYTITNLQGSQTSTTTGR